MIIQENQRIYGFDVTEIKECRELHGRTVRMVHRKTGAQLFWVDNGAENMVFSIAFRTLPEDSTGVFHILEHSVLCGSARFPVKEPFVELMKSSMSTFLNAMTFPDMTMYPVASRNPRDLLNLTEVYLDAVFHPEVIRDPLRFCQEGWHIDQNEAGEPEYRGVVFNEMKGSMSDTDTLIEHQIAQQLFPDTCYGFNSGGDPEVIPDLTWEKFCETYDRFYHPSNAYIYLDGALPMEEMLPLIDSYLAEYERREDLPEFRYQVPVSSEKTIRYDLAADQEEKNHSHLTLARLTGTWKDRTKNMALGIIGDVLAGSNETPLKREVLEQDLAQDLSITVDDTSLQSWVTIHAENLTDGKEQAVLDLLHKTGEKIRREGLERGAVEASLNRMIFHLREEEEPQGIGRCIRCMGDWLYGGNPRDSLETENLVCELNRMLAEGEFDRLAADLLLNREGMVILHSVPSRTLGEEKRRAEEKRIHDIMNGWTREQLEQNQELIRALADWQTAPDPEEALAALPVLKKEDADLPPEWTESEEEKVLGATVLYHTLPCNGVVHLKAYFPLTDLNLEQIPAAGLFTVMLGKLSTASHDALSLQQEIKRYTGTMSFSLMTRSEDGQNETCTPFLTASLSALKEHADRALQLMTEILTETKLDDTDRIREFVQQSELTARQRIVSAGHLFAIRQAVSQYSAEGAVKNALDGAPAVAYIHRFARDPDQETAAFVNLGEEIMRHSFCRKRMIIGWTADGKKDLSDFIGSFPEGTETAPAAAYRAETLPSVGYRIPAQIGYAARAWRLSCCGRTFSGSLWLTTNILSLGYLWNRVRVQGGAYGSGMQVDRKGNLFSYSYRDPTPGKTLTVDAGAAAFLKEFIQQPGELDKYIISSLNDLNPLLSSRDKGMTADLRYLSGYTREMAENTLREILHATPEDLVSWCEVLDRMAAEGSVCVVAHEDALNSCGLDVIREL